MFDDSYERDVIDALDKICGPSLISEWKKCPWYVDLPKLSSSCVADPNGILVLGLNTGVNVLLSSNLSCMR
ncbi:MAG TPA: hypothetical protein O0W91_01645 [Methanocorpusculum sp.]|nr:hypothetical protein [Methanocorpusculum sp.]